MSSNTGIDEYALWTDKVWKSGAEAGKMDDMDLAIVALGLAGETGEALEYIKKYLRDAKDPRKGERFDEFIKELGDVVYYWCRLCRWAGIDPSDVIDQNMAKLNKRHAERIAKRA